jgi:2'-5' RNA ligase
MRIFIGIKASPRLQADIAAWQKKHDDLRVRWIGSEHFHVTLVPPWEERNVDAVMRDLETVAKGERAFEQAFTSISLGPTEKRQNLIWTTGPSTPEMNSLVQKVRKQFGGEGLRFTPHITIARLDSWVQLPAEDVDWIGECDNVCVFMSHGRSEYSVLSRVELL